MTYSAPITQEKAAEYITRCYNELTEAQKARIIKALVEMPDVKFLRDFNKIMNIRLRMFAPKMYQIVYTD